MIFCKLDWEVFLSMPYLRRGLTTALVNSGKV